MTTRFALDKTNARLMGVCSGLARTSGADVTLLRVAAVISLLILGPVSLLVYVVAGWIAPD
jgi:phage shock protein C